MLRRWSWSPGSHTAERLLIFTRYPEPGRTKTRLIPHLGAEEAARLHTEMVRHTLAWADDLARLCDVGVEVHFTGGDLASMQSLFGSQREYCAQAEGDLGARMAHASEMAFRGGARRVVIVGTDCPDLSSDRAASAFHSLAAHDVVLGPALDGGYYLIGLSCARPEIFQEIAWGSERVLAQTLAAAERHALSVQRLAPLDDVDLPEDLPVWQGARAKAVRPAGGGRLSIIIPTLDESAVIGDTLKVLQAAIAPDADCEIIVVDGGSRDTTIEIVRRQGVRTMASERGRARQMNAGAQATSGEILLFLHADTGLPADFEATIRALLTDRTVVAGAFRLAFDAPGMGLRCIERLANLRSSWRGMPYGDQALFFPAKVFRTVGGFPELPIMEDFVLIDALRRRGRVALAPSSVRTSPRRWQKLGVVRTTLINLAMIVGYRLGISPQRLARWYRGGRG